MFSRLYTRVLIGAAALALGGALAALLAAGGRNAWQPGATWLALAVVTLLALAAGHFAALGLTRSLDEISRGARALSDGDYQYRVALQDSDELVAAAKSIHEAAHRMSIAQDNFAAEIERLWTVLESMADGVIAVDDRYNVLLANGASQKLLRFTSPNVIGRPLLEVTRYRTLYDAVGQALSRPGALTTELTVGDKHQQFLLLRTSRLPGEPCPGVVVVLSDVTEVRRLENIRKEFVANVSHELKTPLASIKAHAETLRLGAINDPEHNLSFIGRIEEDADRLHELIIDMLQIARVESHQQAFKIGQVDVGAAVQQCIAQMTPRAEAKEIQLRVAEAPRACGVLADEEGLQTILANLVDNAIKYTPAGGEVTVRWSEEGDWLTLGVEDTGMGIEAALQDRIFERFFRVDRARTRDAGGTGLGLSIVKHLVQAFDGSISVRSKLGQGSQFLVRLPRCGVGKARI